MTRFITPVLTSLAFWISTVITVIAVVGIEVALFQQIRSGAPGRDIAWAWVSVVAAPFGGIFLIILARIVAESITIIFRIERHLRVTSHVASMWLAEGRRQDQPASSGSGARSRVEPRL